MRAPLRAILPAIALTLVSCVSSTATPSPTPGTTASTASSAATPSPSAPPAVLSDRFGLLDGSHVVRETDRSALATLDDVTDAVVSPDGRSLAYWQGTPGYARTLGVFETATLRARTVLTLPEAERAVAIAWATDGSGLLVGVTSRDVVPGGPVEAPYLYVTLREVDVATGAVREIVRHERTTLWYAPIIWDRARRVAAAVEAGPGGFAIAYVLFRDGEEAVRTALPATTLPRLVEASPDGTRVLMSGFFADQPHSLFVWDVATPASPTALPLGPSEFIVRALWRSRDEVVVSLRASQNTLNGDRLEVWRLDGSRRVVYRGEHRLSSVRVDGSAAILSEGIVDLESGAFVPITGLGDALSIRLH